MEQEQKLVRPPFDENGNVVWTDEEKPMKKRALRLWMILLPLGLICVIGAGILLYRATHKQTPQELCRSALRDAFADGFGYKEPMMKALHVADLADILGRGATDVGISLSLRGTNLTLGDLGIKADSYANRALSDYTGFGFGMNIGYENGAVGVDFRGAISALSLSLVKAYYNDGMLYVASPKLLSEVITVPTAEMPARWDSLPIWGVLPADTADNVKATAGKGVDIAKEVILAAGRIRNALLSAYPGGESAIDDIINGIHYEQQKDEKGNPVTESVVVGSEKVPCYIFRIEVEEERFYRAVDVMAKAVGGDAAAAFAHGAWKLDRSDGGNGVQVLAYVTKGGELTRLTADVKGFVSDVPAGITATLRCMGTEDPQDKIYLTVTADVGGKEYEFSLKKTVTATRQRVSSQIEASLKLPDRPQYGVNANITYQIATEMLELTGNTVYRGDTVGTLKLVAECNFRNCWEMNFTELSFEDRYNGKYANFSGRFVCAPTKYGPEKPEGVEVSLLTLTPEDAQAMVQEGLDKIEWYYDKFLR